MRMQLLIRAPRGSSPECSLQFQFALLLVAVRGDASLPVVYSVASSTSADDDDGDDLDLSMSPPLSEWYVRTRSSEIDYFN
jgi:hypothetical protein